MNICRQCVLVCYRDCIRRLAYFAEEGLSMARGAVIAGSYFRWLELWGVYEIEHLTTADK